MRYLKWTVEIAIELWRCIIPCFAFKSLEIVDDYRFIMQVSQSRLNNRGPLIAVIKIEIDSDKFDRIFLHQNDDDFKLAQEFREKHCLDANLVPHIYERIRMSRITVENAQRSPVRTEGNFNRVKGFTDPPTQLYCDQPKQSNQMQPVEQQQVSKGNLQRQIQELLQPQHYPDLFQSIPIHSPSNSREIDCPSMQPNQNQSRRQHELQRKISFASPQSSKNLPFFVGNKDENKARRAPRIYLVQNGNENKKVDSTKPSTNQRVRNQSLTYQSTKQMKFEKETQKGRSLLKSVSKSYLQPFPFVQSKPPKVRIIMKEQLESLRGSVSKCLSKTEISKINRQVTARLYNEAEIKKNYLKIIKEKAKLSTVAKEQEQATHRPEINPISAMIAEGRKRNHPVEHYLIEQGRRIDKRKQEEIAKGWQRQLEGCSFHPQVNQISQKLLTERSSVGSENRHKYTKSHLIQERLFQPILNKISNTIMSQKGPFEDRQREFLEQKNSKLARLVMEKRAREVHDPESGEEFFHPKIAEKTREPQGANIGNYLHRLGKQPAEPPHLQKVEMNPSSQYLVQQMQLKRIIWLFCELDSDQDGVISANRICIDSIGKPLLEIIQPILFEMEELDTELNLEEFRSAMEILHRKLSTQQRSVLYRKPK